MVKLIIICMRGSITGTREKKQILNKFIPSRWLSSIRSIKPSVCAQTSGVLSPRCFHLYKCCGCYILANCIYSVVGCLCLREVGRIDRGLDDAGVDGQDGEDDAGQEHQGQLVDVLDADKHHRGHGGQQDGAVHAHVVEQGSLRFGSFQAFQGKDGRFGIYVDLKYRD